ncbi:MAG: Pyruvate:ferredoxin oxidoreductase and related 2-oxoacid:ferredoxin oxidoreductase, alpha subunit [uncultured Acidilobus sp. MG]|nr:MAG: Pyruvate:ferredoxin oxidoreductase and related 2-oxoacid:ferredoxin oxidoreductase, alpha subunit [uncultured Acidilobus sp. MG]
MTKKALTGNHAVAEAAKLARVKVVAAYPITPQTTIVERLAEMIEKGELEAKMIRVESEHSAMAATLGAAAAGARAFTATSSHGLLYMHEVLWWTAGARIPVVMAVVTRAIGPPWNIHVEHSDVMDQRDTGWIISIAQENQEAFDLTIQAFRISEDPRVYLPMIVSLDGFILSHTVAPVDVPSQEDVDAWLPPRRQPYVITPESNVVMGNIANDEEYYMMRFSIQAAMQAAKKVIDEVDEEFGKAFGRRYGGLVECYLCDDADYVMLLAGSWAGDAKKAAEQLREEGIRAGVARVRFIRPWPEEFIRERLVNVKGVIVFDRSISFGSYGQLFTDTAATLYGQTSLRGVIAGLGGVDVKPEDFASEVRDFVSKVEERGRVYEPRRWLLPKKYSKLAEEVVA